MKVKLLNGPLDGQTDSKARDTCVIYRRRASGPTARYRNTGKIDNAGYHLFEWYPPKPDEPEPTEEVYDAD